VLGVAPYHPGMVDVGNAGQSVETKENQSKPWALLLAVAATLISSVTSVGLQVWNTVQNRTQQVATAEDGKRYAYNMFLSQVWLTERRLVDVLECQKALAELARPVSKVRSDGGSAREIPSRAGWPNCDSLGLDKQDSLPEMKAAYERLHGRWTEEYERLAEPRREMMKYGTATVIDLVDRLYRSVGSLTEYDSEWVADNSDQLVDEFCQEVPTMCAS
jgi:hypothetical protein